MVFAIKLFLPTAVLSEAVVLACSELTPTPVLFEPVVLTNKTA